MKDMSKREQTILVTASTMVLFLVIFKWGGLGETLNDLRDTRASLTNVERTAEEMRDKIADFPELIERYKQYDNISLLTAEGNHADVFLSYASDIIDSIDLSRTPRIQPPEVEEVPDVPGYVQILLPIQFEAKWDDVLLVLTTFDQQRLLIRDLEINSREPYNEVDLQIKLTLSRFVRLEEEAVPSNPRRNSRGSWGGRS